MTRARPQRRDKPRLRGSSTSSRSGAGSSATTSRARTTAQGPRPGLETDIVKAERMLVEGRRGRAGEHERLSREALSLAEENLDLARRYVELEEHATSMANLYAATFQLHVTLDPAAVVRAIADIAINLIGAGEFVVYLVDDARNDFVVAVRGRGTSRRTSRSSRRSRTASSATPSAARQTVFAETNGAAGATPRAPICCTPLFLNDRLVGVLTIYALLSHKKSFSGARPQAVRPRGRAGGGRARVVPVLRVGGPEAEDGPAVPRPREELAQTARLSDSPTDGFSDSAFVRGEGSSEPPLCAA